jgi:hypothetical protein
VGLDLNLEVRVRFREDRQGRIDGIFGVSGMVIGRV